MAELKFLRMAVLGFTFILIPSFAFDYIAETAAESARESGLIGILFYTVVGIITKILGLISIIYFGIVDVIQNVNHPPMERRDPAQVARHAAGWLALSGVLWINHWWPIVTATAAGIAKPIVNGVVYAWVMATERKKVDAPDPEDIDKTKMEAELQRELNELEKLKGKVKMREEMKEK